MLGQRLARRSLTRRAIERRHFPVRPRRHRPASLQAVTQATRFDGQAFRRSTISDARSWRRACSTVLAVPRFVRRAPAAMPSGYRCRWGTARRSARAEVKRGSTRFQADVGRHVSSGQLQSIPSRSIDNCTSVRETLPLFACGQTKQPRSRRFVSRHRPLPDHHRTLSISPRRLRNANTWPQYGSSVSAVSTLALDRSFRHACR
jgi:hypothetical protein